eukprot:gene3124-3402_t
MSSLAPPPAPATTFLPCQALHKRVRAINAEGLEEHAEDNPWIHMQLKDPFQQVQVQMQSSRQQPGSLEGGSNPDDDEAAAAAAAAEQLETAPRPEEVINAFAAAKGELEWLLALLNTLQEGKYLTVGRCEKVLVDMALGANSRQWSWWLGLRLRLVPSAPLLLLLTAGAVAAVAPDAFVVQVHSEPADSPYAVQVPGVEPQGPPSVTQKGLAGGGIGLEGHLMQAAV